MSSWLFIFGRTPELSFLELSALVDRPVTRLTGDVARIEGSLSQDKLIQKLGGTVKIARELGSVTQLTPEALLPFLGDTPKALTFGVSVYGDTQPIDSGFLRGIKKALEDRGVHSRYVVADDTALSSVVVSKQNVHELVVIKTNVGYIVGETVAVQDFESWNKRDYGRPFADPKSGMLPPKVARIAVNIAGRGGTLLDPFCGMGTIVAEAALSGWHVIGSDQSQDVVAKAKKNIEWVQRPLTPSFEKRGNGGVTFFVSDATHVSEHVAALSVDAIVTEPFLGEAKRVKSQEPEEIKNVIKGLEKLYIGCLRDWYHILRPAGKIVIALPEYAVNGKTFFVKSVIDRCEILGYTVSLGPLEYSRPQAIVKRKFYVFTKR